MWILKQLWSKIGDELKKSTIFYKKNEPDDRGLDGAGSPNCADVDVPPCRVHGDCYSNFDLIIKISNLKFSFR